MSVLCVPRFTTPPSWGRHAPGSLPCAEIAGVIMTQPLISRRHVQRPAHQLTSPSVSILIQYYLLYPSSSRPQSAEGFDGPAFLILSVGFCATVSRLCSKHFIFGHCCGALLSQHGITRLGLLLSRTRGYHLEGFSPSSFRTYNTHDFSL